MKSDKERIIQKQNKILAILKTFSDKRLDELTKNEFNFMKMSKQELYLFMECVWLDLGKEQATNEEMTKGIRNVHTLFILENLKRHGLVKINKRGFFDRTKLGNKVKKYLENKT